MNYELPESVVIDGKAYAVCKRGDWRMILDVIAALTDPDLTDGERLTAALTIFLRRAGNSPEFAGSHTPNVMVYCGGEETSTNKQPPRLMDWEQDLRLIVAPVSRIIDSDIRSLPYLHWWSFLSAYMEIGDCTFATVVSIRGKQNKGKTLEKWERDYLREHADIVRLKQKNSCAEQAYLDGFVD